MTNSGWVGCPEVVDRLRSLVEDPVADVKVRAAILWMFEMGKVFSSIRPIAVKLAGDETAPAMAREAAGVIAFESIDYGCPSCPDRLQALFDRSTGIQRQEAAITIGSQTYPVTGTPTRQAVIAELIGVFTDRTLPPETRGRALEAAGFFRSDETMVTALVGMLEPNNWFFGAQGEHWLVHSLVPTIGSLYGVKSSYVEKHIDAVSAMLDRLPKGQRSDVELELRVSISGRAR